MPAAGPRADGTPSVPGLQRGLGILELLSESPEGLTLPVVARKLGVPKSSAHCLLLTLERTGYVTRTAHAGRFRLSRKLLGLAGSALFHFELRERGRPNMRQLAQKTSLTVHLGVLERNDVIVLEKAESTAGQRLATWPGKRLDVHCTALGKVLLSGLVDEDVRGIVREHGLPRHNENTIASLSRLRAEIELTRERGFGMQDEENEIGCRCIGAPIRDSAGRVIAALSLSGNINEIHRGNAVSLSSALILAAARISGEVQRSPEFIQHAG
jgi:DNA-binding IclR family transcriptional regulator